MAYPYVAPPSPEIVTLNKVWELVEYFGKCFPEAHIKVEVEYNPRNKYCVVHKGEKK